MLKTGNGHATTNEKSCHYPNTIYMDQLVNSSAMKVMKSFLMVNNDDAGNVYFQRTILERQTKPRSGQELRVTNIKKENRDLNDHCLRSG